MPRRNPHHWAQSDARSYGFTALRVGGLPAAQGVQRGRRVGNELALTGIGGQEYTIARFETASMPQGSGYAQMALAGDVKRPMLPGADDQSSVGFADIQTQLSPTLASMCLKIF